MYPYFEAENATISKIPIRIDFSDGYAKGYYYPDNGSVEILKDSSLYMDLPNPGLYPDVEQLRSELIETGIIREHNNRLMFASNYYIYPKRVNATALSAAASLILHGSRNEWEYWVTEDGKQIGKQEKN